MSQACHRAVTIYGQVACTLTLSASNDTHSNAMKTVARGFMDLGVESVPHCPTMYMYKFLLCVAATAAFDSDAQLI